MENLQKKLSMQSQVYLLRQELLAVYSDELGKGCILVPPGALITVFEEEQPFFRFSWDRRTLRAFAEDIQHRSEIMPSTVAQYATNA